ncbi:hybrid sensor histidine kinase/response regulator transcription factor [Spirosoma fluminis]
MNVLALSAQPFKLPEPQIITDRQGLPQAFVPSIIQDKQGFIWMATRDGLCRYDGQNFKVFQPGSDGRPALSSSAVLSLKLDPAGRIWVSSDQGDIDVFDPRRETFINFSSQSWYRRAFDHDTIFVHVLDSRGRLWLSFERHGVARVDPVTRRVERYRHRAGDPSSLSSDTVVAFVEDREGNMWFATSNGLDRLDNRTGKFRHYRQQAGQSNAIPENGLKTIFLRQNGDLLLLSSQHLTVFNPRTEQSRAYPLPVDVPNVPWWLRPSGTVDSQGNYYFNYSDFLFRFNDQHGVQLIDQGSGLDRVQSTFIDRSDVLWLGTNGQGVRKYNLKVSQFNAALYQSSFVNDVLRNQLGIPEAEVPYFDPQEGQWPYNFRYTTDAQGKLWFNVGTSPFYRFDLKTKTLTKIPFPVRGKRSWDDQIAPMATDPQGRVWAVHDGEARWYEQGDWHLLPVALRPTIQARIVEMVADDQALWMATGTKGLFRVDRSSGQIRNYSFQTGNPASLSSNKLLCLFDDPIDKHILWIGTSGTGLCRFDKRTGKSQRLTRQNGLPNNVIYTAIPDRQGFLWIATNQGLCRLNRRTFEVRTFTRDDGLPGDEFNRFHFLVLPDGRLILGGLKGLISFRPTQLREDTYQPVTEVTDIAINNQSVSPGPGSLIDTLPVQMVQHLELAHDQNFLTVRFAALQFNGRDQLRYRYKLSPVSRDWIVTNRPEATYTNLSPGTYTLQLNVTNTSGRWSTHVRTLTITIHPPLWATWWAYVLYALALGGGAAGLFRVYLKHKQAQQLKLIDELKTRLFSNITHEFRTPLTLILAPTEKLKQKWRDPDDVRWLGVIERNAHQLLGLINQLMDLAKLEAHALQVEEVRGNLVSFVEQVILSFEAQAEARSIQLIFHHEDLHAEYYFDARKLERIVYNLVSNALKFTSAGGQVDVRLTPGVTLTVTDTGTGIPEYKLGRIFDRFYQVDDSSTRQQEGTGIGLALVKELVDLQKGTINVVSDVGRGSSFIVHLPYLPIAPGTAPAAVETPIGSAPTQKVDADFTDEQPVILLVEDNDELAEFIADSLSDRYQVYRAANGAVGWEQAIALLPDLIISDVLVPIMNGYTLCEQIKKDQRTSHIPVMILTAKSSYDSRITGLSAGADDYLTKPFHVQELQLRVRNLLEQRRQLRDWIHARLTRADEPLPSLGPDSATNDPFLDRVYALLEDHLDDSSFRPDDLIEQSGLSRMSLHRKLKALTGMSAGEIIRAYRLKRAAELLEQGLSSTETAYRVGFESPAYFTKRFREQYQLTPSEFTAAKVANRKKPV